MYYGDVIASKQVSYSDASITISPSLSFRLWIPQVTGQPHGLFFSIQLDSLYPPRWAASPPRCSNHYLSLQTRLAKTIRSQNQRRGCRLCEGERLPCHWKDRQNGHWPRGFVFYVRLSQMTEKRPERGEGEGEKGGERRRRAGKGKGGVGPPYANSWIRPWLVSTVNHSCISRLSTVAQVKVFRLFSYRDLITSDTASWHSAVIVKATLTRSLTLMTDSDWVNSALSMDSAVCLSQWLTVISLYVTQ